MSRLTSFRRTVLLTLGMGALIGGALAATSKTAQATVPQTGYRCNGPSQCDAGSYTCVVVCGNGICACTIS